MKAPMKRIAGLRQAAWPQFLTDAELVKGFEDMTPIQRQQVWREEERAAQRAKAAHKRHWRLR